MSPSKQICIRILFVCLNFFCLFKFSRADVICEDWFGYPIKYCYGLTAYCCGEHFQQCCWESLWKIWWFWIVLSVLFVSMLACCGYLCSLGEENDRYRIFRSSSFSIGRWRRVPLNNSQEEEWKPIGVALPAYSQNTASPINPQDGQNNPQRNSPYLEPPPPYETALNQPQPPARETTPLTAVSSASTSNRSYTTTSSR